MAAAIQDLPGEIWKPVVGWEGLYEVSNMGRVKSCARSRRGPHGSVCHHAAYLMHPQSKRGYPQVHLRFDERSLFANIHALVLIAFVGPRPKGFHACHFDGDRTNNRDTNLRWDTVANNCADKVRHGTSNRGERHGHAILTNAQVLEMRRLRRKGRSREKLAAMFGVAPATVWGIVTRRTWRHL